MARADEGRSVEARQLITEAERLAGPTDFLELRADAFESLAHVEACAGNAAAWKAAMNRTLGEYERKGHVVGARRIRNLLAAGPPARSEGTGPTPAH
jgi:hypothetical protein